MTIHDGIRRWLTSLKLELNLAARALKLGSLGRILTHAISMPIDLISACKQGDGGVFGKDATAPDTGFPGKGWE